MEISATHRYARLSPQKCRLVLKEIRGMRVYAALELLAFSPKKAAKLVRAVLVSAIANAENNEGLDIDELKVSTAYANEAPTMRRFRARAKGRGTRVLKRNSHITVNVKSCEG